VGWEWPSHRGRYLACWGVIHLMFGVMLWNQQPVDPVGRYVSLGLPNHWWALYAWAGGAWSLFTAFRFRASSIPPFTLLSTLLVLRALGHLRAAVLIPDPVQLASVLMWATLVVKHVFISRWPNPQPVEYDEAAVTEALVAVVAAKMIKEDGESDREHLLRIVDEEEVE
jgi:hypothetical protein